MPVLGGVLAQTRQPLIPSARNDRKMAEERMRQQQQQSQNNSQKPDEPKDDSSKSKDDSRTSRADSREIGEPSTREVLEFVPEDSVIYAETKVKQLGADNYEELTQPQSNMDLNDPTMSRRKLYMTL